MRLLPVLTLIAACAACPTPTRIDPTKGDAGPPVQYSVSAACANLAAPPLGCAIGKDPRCRVAFEEAVDGHFTTGAAMACATAARTPAEVVGCDPHFFSCP